MKDKYRNKRKTVKTVSKKVRRLEFLEVVKLVAARGERLLKEGKKP
jgi:hypothetical protein